MYKRLQELGIPSVIIRNNDEYLPKEERIERVLNAYNNDKNTLLISNHINAGGGEGAEIVYSLLNEPTLAQLVLDNIGEAGQIKRRIYQRRFPENPNQDYYYILRETGNVEPILIEYGFIDNEKDAKKLKNNLNNYVEAAVKAIAQYAGYQYIKPNTNKNNYIVEKGDTLWSIAKKNNLTVNELKELNNLNTDILQIGQSLIISKNNSPDLENYIKYKVKKGDSLWSISRKYNVSIDELINTNNLTGTNIKIDQELIIPTKNKIYTVKKGDTLWSIAKENNLTVNELKELNNLTGNIISIGQQLIIK